MDVDNVERGAGGKNEKPQDHNRDWSDTPHWPEVKAAMQHISAMNAEGHFDLFMDLHNPAPADRTLDFYLPPREIMLEHQAANLDRFLNAAKLELSQAPIPHKGKVVYTGPKYDAKWEFISGNWVARHTREHVVAGCLETAWNTPQSTQAGYLEVGTSLGLAMERYFQAPNK